MAKVETEGAGKYSYHYPRLTVVVTSRGKGRDDAMTVGWHSPISVKPPLYGIAITSGRFTYELIMDSGEFAINFVDYTLAELLASVGGSKGKEIDKFERFKIAREEPSKISVPLLKDAYASYECKLSDHKSYGDHVWVVGEVIATHFLREAFTESEILDTSLINPVLYLGKDLYVTTAKDTPKHLDRQIYGRSGSD